MKMKALVVIGICLGMTGMAWAGEQVGKLTQVEGVVQIYTNPSKHYVEKKKGHKALFEGEYYDYAAAAPGDSLQNGNVIATLENSKARIVFPNGDQFFIGPYTFYRVKFSKDSATDARPEVLLAHGKFRGVVEKGGPRSHLLIRSHGVTMGVRGTDFFINSTQPEVEVSTLRGEVEVKKEKTAAGGKTTTSEPVLVKSGQSVEVAVEVTAKKEDKGAQSALGESASAPAKAEQPMEKAIIPRRTTHDELVEIHQVSKISSEAHKDLKAEVKKEVEKLETKAVEMTIQDIKKTDPSLATKLDEKKMGTVEAVQTAVVENLMKEAPKTAKAVKPNLQQLDQEQNPYKHYFKEQDGQ